LFLGGLHAIVSSILVMAAPEPAFQKKRHGIADAILVRALSSLVGVESALAPALSQPSELEQAALASVEKARAELDHARGLLLSGGRSGTEH
jgi:hypothetical protein